MSVGPLKDRAGKEVKGSEEMANLLAQHYSSVFQKEILPMEEIVQLYHGENPLLNTEFTEAFVRLQLSRLRETLAIWRLLKMKNQGIFGPDIYIHGGCHKVKEKHFENRF